MDAVAARADGIGLAEISTRLGLHNSTAFHLIKTLEKLDVVVQDPDTKRYRIGSHLFSLAAAALNENTMLAAATPILERLSRDTGEAAHLAVREQHEIVVIALTAATGLLQLSGRTGATRPPHATAIGKILLAAVPPEDLPVLLDRMALPVFTSNTITDREALRREIDRVRVEGIAYDNGELDEDVRCAALPVRDFSGRCVAAIGISGPIWKLTQNRMKKKVARLREAAAELECELGRSD